MPEHDRRRPALRIVRNSGPDATEPDNPNLSIADVAKACGLPQPVIAQLVPRTWTAEGWMYTYAQLQLAVEIASAWTITPDSGPSSAQTDRPSGGPGGRR
jgi:hypothetical protein